MDPSDLRDWERPCLTPEDLGFGEDLGDCSMRSELIDAFRPCWREGGFMLVSPAPVRLGDGPGPGRLQEQLALNHKLLGQRQKQLTALQPS